MIISIIEQNKDFIAQEALLYALEKFPNETLTVDKEFFRRDVHMIVDIIMGELHLQGGVYPIDVVDPTIDLCENFWTLNRFKKSFRVFKQKTEMNFTVVEYVGNLSKDILENKTIEQVRGQEFFQIFDYEQIESLEKINQIETVISLIAANLGSADERNYHIDFVEDYWEKGFILTKTPNNIHKRLWNEINATKWIASNNNTYKKVPDWYTEIKRIYVDPTGNNKPTEEKREGYLTYRHAPQSLKDIAIDLINDPMFDPLKMYRPPKAIPVFLHFWNGSENSPHHVDAIDGSDVMIFCYATDAGPWKEEWGGYINIMKEVRGEYKYTKNIMPDDGNMVIVNNSAPIFKHGIRNMVNKDVNRYTFIFHYTWAYNFEELEY